MKRTVTLLLAVACICMGCTDEEATRKALDSQGFTSVQIGGYAPYSCSDSDVTATKFTANNPQGKHVEGVVCCGRLKACTVRW